MSVAAGARAADVQSLGWTLLHFLWQGSLAAGVLATLHLLFKPRSAQVRYLLASGTLLGMFVLPVATFVIEREGIRLGTPPSALAETAGPATVANAPGPLGQPGPLAALRDTAVRDRLGEALPALVLGWCAGVALLSARSLGGWLVAQRLKRSGLSTIPERLQQAVDRLRRRMGLSRPVQLLESAAVEVPTVIGWLRPVILLPVATLAGLTPIQVELILAHELAHVRRLDYLVNLFQSVVETLLFYHPAVWWVSHRMRVEREHCCDDTAVSACGDVLSYARALTDLEGLRATVAGVAMAATGGSLLERIARLVGRPPSHVPRSSRWLAGLTLLALSGAAFTAAPTLRSDGPRYAANVAREEPAVSPALVGVAAEPSDRARAARSRPARAASSAPASERSGEATEGRPDPPIEKILELMRAGVTPEYVEGMTAAGYPSLSWQQLIDLRSRGVGPDFVKGLAEVGFKGLTPDRLIDLRSQGVGPEFVAEMKKSGYDNLSVTQLISLRAQGVSPEYVSELAAAGYRGLTPSRLIALRSQGVSAEYVRELKELGYADLSASVLMGLRSQGVDPEYLRGLKAQGYSGLSTGVLIELRNHGVGPEFIRGLKEQGLSGLSTETLVELRNHGVTPEFVREVKEAGYSKLSPAELVELRSHGVPIDLIRRLQGALKKKGNGQ